MKFLFLAGEYGKWQELKYASCVAERIAEQIRKVGHEVIIVRRPSPENANEAIKKHKPDVVWWVGHGNEAVVTLERVKLWISVIPGKERNTKILDNTIACALSCLTGAYLGWYVTSREKCRAYLGYKGRFWFVWCADPLHYNCACQGRNPWGVREELWKKMVECMHEANLYFVLGLAKGMGVEDAKNYSIERFNYWIDYFENVEPRDEKERSVIRVVLWCLITDRNVTALYGGEAGVVRPVRMALAIPAALLALGSLISYVASRR